MVVWWMGSPAWSAEPDPEAVRRLMEKYEREAAEEAAKKAPAPKPRPKPEPAPKPRPKPEPAPKPSPEVDHDREAWRSAEKCGKAACFRAYLKQYPNGRFAEMARAQLEEEAVPPESLAPVERPRPSIEPAMVSITGGCFQMGSPESEEGRDSDERQHRMCVKDFALGQNEVTVGEFQRFMAATNYRTDAEKNADGKEGCFVWSATGGTWDWRAGLSWRKSGYSQQDTSPVVCVSWNDAQAYVKWLSRETGQSYRLPTEAEWEYAARAGTTSARYWGDDPNQACRYANVADQTKGTEGHGWNNKHDCTDGYWYPAPVGTFQPNAWKLNDMLGNAWEWTCSTYDKDYGGVETKCIEKDATGPLAVRGGSWYYRPDWVRSALRDRGDPASRTGDLGFRLARSL